MNNTEWKRGFKALTKVKANPQAKCKLCQHFFFEMDKSKNWPVMDHNHFTGKFRQVICNNCNLKLKKVKMLPVFGHNLMGYDEKLFIRALQGQTHVVAKTKENFISLTLKYNKIDIRFLDSYKFFNTSLDALVNNLKSTGANYFIHTQQNFSKEHLELCMRKGVFPYSYITDDSVLDETQLPPPKAFYNNLTGKQVSEEDYNHARNVWKAFKCQTLRDYQHLYLKLDCCLLADVMEHFRKTMFDIYGLDACHALTIPSYTEQCCLYYTQQQLELIQDVTMYNFLEQGIRGGISTAIKRYAKSNNPYQKDYDPSQPTSYLMYVDANNLYGWAMLQSLPVSNFHWDDKVDEEAFKDPNSTIYDKDCILDVDLHCPKDKYNYFSDYPLCPHHEQNRLMCSFYPKHHYVCHSRYLKKVLELGYKLDKVHKVLRFQSKLWMNPYITLNSILRAKAVNAFEKDNYKLMNNGNFGKQMENKRHRHKIVIALGDKVRKHYNKDTFKDVMALSKENDAQETTYIVQHHQTEVLLDKPVYGGLTILDLSKILMLQYYYEELKPKYGDNIELIYTDTDSFIFQVWTEDFYKDMDVEKWYDTSNFPADFRCLDGSLLKTGQNKKVPGFFKDELGGESMKEVVALSSKMYAYKTVENKVTKKAKGVTKKVMDNVLFEDYEQALKGNILYGKMDLIRSHHHELYTEEMYKKVLDPFDKKRCICADGIHTLPWGM